MFPKLRGLAIVHDEITPPQVKLVQVDSHAERVERILLRARELREQMGERYLCNEANRVKRLDGKVYGSPSKSGGNVRPLKRKKAA